MAGGIVSALLIGLHWLVISPVQADSMASVATASVRKTLFDVPWFPRSDYFTRYFSWQPFSWLMIGGGAALALMRRRFIIAALALSGAALLASLRNRQPLARTLLALLIGAATGFLFLILLIIGVRWLG